MAMSEVAASLPLPERPGVSMTLKPRSGEGYGALDVIAVDTNVVVRLLARDDET